jgi:hypothetical protein
MDYESSWSIPIRGGGNPQSNEELRINTRQSKTPFKYKYYALMNQFMNVVEPLND